MTNDNDQVPQTEGMATVRYLPTRLHTDTGDPAGGEMDVVEGTVLDASQWAALNQRNRAAARRELYGSDARLIVVWVKQASRHPHTRTVARHIAYVAVGVTVVAKRVWDGRTTARYERMMRAAEAMGDREAALEWEVRTAAFRRERHQRRMDLLALPVRVAVLAPKAAAGGLGVLLGVGVLLAVADHDPAKVVVPVMAAADLVRLLVTIASVVWGPLLLAAPWVAALGCWAVGRTHGITPGWLGTSAEDVDLPIDETTIARALQALRISQINDYLKQGLPLQYLTPVRQEGRGTYAVLRLPAGVTAEKIAKRRADLATGLHRRAGEVWPTTGSEAGIVDLWIADKGALAEGAGPYPLLKEGTVDVFKGVPFGRTLRGTPLIAPVMERNTIAGGLPGQGKSSAARVIMIGCALDPTVELRIWVPDANYDFEAFKPRCSRYVMGAEDKKIAQIRDDLAEVYEEVQTRGELLIRHQIPAVTRQIATRNVGLHPLICLLEEAHIAINHPDYGKEISSLLVDIVRLGRKRGIHIIVSTQAPTKDSMPRDVTRNCSNGIAFAVGDHVANDALLGQGAYKAGHRATELIPGTDRGTALVKGFTGERSDIVQVYFLDVAKGSDQVTPIIKRSLTQIDRLGRPVPGTQTPRQNENRNLLDDLDEVVGSERVRLADLPARLRDLAPLWGPYKTLTGTQLRKLLTGYGVRITNTGNIPRLDPAELRKVIAQRSTHDLDQP